ncbi:MAG: PrsW family glutamic-type intramembrane protease [Alphaproteobacteria bacterium]
MPIWLHVVALAPALLLLWYFTSRDLYPEPRRLIWITFALGFGAAAPTALIGEIFFYPFADRADNPWIASAILAFPIVGGIEELSKFAVLYIFCRRWNDFDEPMDGLVYGVAASLGFAAIENWSYVYDSGLETALWRAISAVPFHAMAGAIMGYYFGLAHFIPNQRRFYLALALLIPIVLHGAYDYPLILQELLFAEGQAADWLGVAVLPILALETGIALALARRLRAAQEAGHHEAADDPDYHGLHHPYQAWSRHRHLAGPVLLMIGGALVWETATELAMISSGLAAGWLGYTGTNATILAVGDAFMTLGSDGIAMMIGIKLAILLAGLWMFRQGITLLNRRNEVEQPCQPSEAV